MPITVPNLDDRDFDQLVAEAKARIPVHTPEWTNFNDADPGITLVQVFAFLTENLLYRSNRIPEANRRKFLTLLNIPLQPASAGIGLVAFRNDRGPLQAWPMNPGVELRAGKVPFRTRTGVCILPVTAALYTKKPQNSLTAAQQARLNDLFQSFLDQANDQLQFYEPRELPAPETGKPLPLLDLADSINGAIDRSLWMALVGPQGAPVDAVRAAIANQTLTIGIYPDASCAGKTLYPATVATQPVADPGLVFEIAAPDPNVTDGLPPARYKRLSIEYAENVLQSPGIVQVTLPRYEELLLWDFDPEEEGTGDYPPLVEDQDVAKRIATWIRIRLPLPQQAATNGPATSSTAAPQLRARLNWAGVNAARVVQAVPVTNERLGVGTGAPDQAGKVANTPIILEQDPSTATTDQAAQASAFILEVENLDGGWDTWQQVDDLYAAGPNDAVYALDPESGVVSFGNGLRGLRPSLGRTIRASYDYGGGSAGKVAIGAINKSPSLPGGFKVENPLPTWGADDGETVTEGEADISRYLRHRDRLVTASDFRDIALRTPGVDMGRVEVLPLFNPNLFQPGSPIDGWPGTVTVMVIPRSDPVQPDAPVPDRLFVDAACRWLDPRRLLTTEIYVRGPIYVPLWVSVGIVTLPGQVREQIHRDVQAALRDYLSPLVGGPAVPGASNLDTAGCADQVQAANACPPPPRGTGWPLNMEVRVQDLEAVATRVLGVRYVDSIRLGIQTGSGSGLTEVQDKVSITGLQLPWLVAAHVNEGAAEDLGDLLGGPAGPQNLKPVPVTPQLKC